MLATAQLRSEASRPATGDGSRRNVSKRPSQTANAITTRTTSRLGRSARNIENPPLVVRAAARASAVRRRSSVSDRGEDDGASWGRVRRGAGRTAGAGGSKAPPAGGTRPGPPAGGGRGAGPDGPG